MRPRQIAPVALVLGLTVAAFLATRIFAQHSARRDDDHRAELATAQVRGRVAQAVSLTESLRRFIVDAGGTGVTSAQFARNAFWWLNPAGFPAAAWAEPVSDRQRTAYEDASGEPIVSPNTQYSPLPSGSRASYLPATFVSGFFPMSVAGIDLSGEPGMIAALERATRLDSVTATQAWGSVAGTTGFFLVAPAPNLISGTLHAGYVALFVPDATLLVAAGTPETRVMIGPAATTSSGAGGPVWKTFRAAGQQFAVAIPRRAPGGMAATLPWIILSGGLILGCLVAALGLNGARRAQAQAEANRIFNLSSDLIGVADLKGYLKRVNPAFERTLGYSSEELLSRPYIEFIHPDDRGPTVTAAGDTLERGEVADFEARWLRKDGSVRWLEWSGQAAPGEAALYGTARDITERKQLEAQQAALRRVATAVARGGSPDDVFAATVAELHAVVDDDATALMRYEDDGTATILATLGDSGYEVGARIGLDGESVTAKVRHSGRTARIDDFLRAVGPIPERLSAHGIRSGVGAPIVVEGRLWGVMTCGWRTGPPSQDAEVRVSQFTDLVGTAISNAENRAELLASRARIVTTADQTRRRIERDLHDGVQQRLVTLTMKLRALEPIKTPGAVTSEVEEIAAGLDQVLDDLREAAQGLHPVILSQGGLAAALKALGRRSSLPVELDVRVPERLPDAVEVAAYYVVAEALTNAAKHSHASFVSVEAEAIGGRLRISVQDDGVGGADPGRGSGLVGLRDRVEALGGKFSLQSPSAGGTNVRMDLPLAD